MSGKGSGRRPTDTTHALRCERVGHWWVGDHCFRCGAVRRIFAMQVGACRGCADTLLMDPGADNLCEKCRPTPTPEEPT